MVARLQARLLPGAMAQSASEAQRSWQLLMLPMMMHRLGGMQWASVRHTRQVLEAGLQRGVAMGHVESSTHCTHVRVAGLQTL